MSQPVDNVLKGCGKEIHISRGEIIYCFGDDFCPSCKLKMQGMIEILEDELKLLNDVQPFGFIKESQANEILILPKIKEVQSDLTKLKEGLK